MKTLVLYDDYWPPARVPREGLRQLIVTEFTFDWIENAQDWSSNNPVLADLFNGEMDSL